MDYALITVFIKNSNAAVEMSLPVHMKIAVLREKIVELLSARTAFGGSISENARLYQGPAELNENYCLADYGVWDGGIITLS